MSGVIKTSYLVIVWEFIVLVTFLIGNLVVNAYVVPTFDSMDYNNEDFYDAATTPAKAAFSTSMFILAVLPLAYLFVRFLLKREQTAYQYPYSCCPARSSRAFRKWDNLRGWTGGYWL